MRAFVLIFWLFAPYMADAGDVNLCIADTASVFFRDPLKPVLLHVPAEVPELDIICQLLQRSFKMLLNASDAEESVNYVIIWDSEISELGSTLEELYKYPRWSSETEFLVVLNQDAEAKARGVVVRELEARRVNRIAMIHQQEIFFWHAFHGNSCRNASEMPLSLGLCGDGISPAAAEALQAVAKGRATSCSITSRYVNEPPYVEQRNGTMVGYEVVLLRTIASRLGAELVFTTLTSTGDIFENGSASGVYPHLMEGSVDVALGSFVGKPLRYALVDPIQPHAAITMAAGVHRAHLLPRWQNIFKVFRLATWLAAAGLLAMAAGLMHHLGASRSPLLSPLAALLGAAPSFSAPDTPSRLFTAFWLVYALHISAVYQSTLFSFTTTPRQLHQVNTLVEAVQQGFRFCSTDFWARTSSFSDEEKVVSMRPLLFVGEDVLHCLDRTQAVQDIVTLMEWPQFTAAVKLRPQVVVLEESLASWWISIMAKKGFKFKARFDDLVLRMQAAGLVSLWQRQYNVDGQYARSREESTPGAVPLTLEHIQGALMVLAIGWAVAVVFVLVEILTGKIKSRKCMGPGLAQYG